MIELQEKIHTLKIKLKANIEVLKDEENNISEINNTYNQRLTEWEKPIRTFSKNIYAVNRNLCTSNTNKVFSILINIEYLSYVHVCIF
jgi:hypothetical protein